MDNTKPEYWERKPFDAMGGYDCMYGSITIGRATLDGANYGQNKCDPITAEQRVQMEADADLIEAIPDLLDACTASLLREDIASDELGAIIRAAINKAKGKPPLI